VTALTWLFATYGAVLAAELLGDKSLYSVTALATRYRPIAVFGGLAVAFSAKSLAAVLLAQSLARVAAPYVAIASAITFFASAVVLWRSHSNASDPLPAERQTAARGALVAFSSIFFSEWGDVGQITTATLALRYNAPVAVWLGASLALCTKGLLGMAFGVGLRRRIPVRALRVGSVTFFLVMSILSVLYATSTRGA